MNNEEYTAMDEFELEPENWEQAERTEKTAFLAALAKPAETDKDIEDRLKSWNA